MLCILFLVGILLAFYVVWLCLSSICTYSGGLCIAEVSACTLHIGFRLCVLLMNLIRLLYISYVKSIFDR